MITEVIDKHNAVTSPIYGGLGSQVLAAQTCEHSFEDAEVGSERHGLRVTRQHCLKCKVAQRVRMEVLNKNDDISEILVQLNNSGS